MTTMQEQDELKPMVEKTVFCRLLTLLIYNKIPYTAKHLGGSIFIEVKDEDLKKLLRSKERATFNDDLIHLELEYRVFREFRKIKDKFILSHENGSIVFYFDVDNLEHIIVIT